MQNKIENNKQESIDLSYLIAVESYEWAAKRYDSMDSRIQSILGLGMTLTLAAPIGFSALRLSVNHGWFIAAAIFFILALCAGTIARFLGSLIVLSPRVLYEKWLKLSEYEFKKKLILYAGRHLDKAARVVLIKHRFLIAVAVMFLLEVLCLALSVSYRP
jgi:hypothetical protein